MQYFIGLALIAIGLTLVIKSEWFLNNFGRIGWFEEHLATSGGSRLGYKLVGMLFIFIGLLCATNMINGFLGWTLAPLIKYY